MMKKVIVLLTALALTVGFTGCQRESVQTSGASSGRSVNTQLVLSVANGTAQTKQTADAVQVTGGFQGLKDAYLLTYTQAADGKILAAPATSPNEPIELNYLFSGEATRRIVAVKLPEGTNTLVFYGRGTKDAAPNDYGKLGAYSVDQNLGNSYFELGPRLTDVAGFSAVKKLLAGILTDVMATSLDGADFTQDEISVAAADYASCKSWATYAGITNKQSLVESGTVWYIWEEKLANLYNKMTGITYSESSADIELRAGSGAAILAMTKDLWKEIKSITSATATATTKAEAVAKKLALAIDAKLKTYFTYSDTTGENPQPDWETLAFKANSNLLSLASLGLTDEEKTAVGDYSPAEFPSNFNLMAGAAYLTFDVTNKKFSYPDKLNMVGMGGTSADSFAAVDFYYPVELVYFGNSPVQTSEVEYSTSDYPSTASDWSKKNWKLEGWPGSHVTASSRSVAMVNNIRYGAAMLETKVGYTDAVTQAAEISTNNPNISGQMMPVGAGTFKLTGVVIGGQPKRVGWDFLPVSGEGFIYDNFHGENGEKAISVPLSGTSTPNYTVVFDNYNAASAAANTAQDKVYVALEFLNNGDDFYGKKNWVRKGDYFYLIGMLDPGDPQAEPSTEKDIDWPSDGTIIPPYNADGTSTQQPRIFVQDYKTTVTFKIGPNSLQYAYLTVPDLRSSNMTLGLSVDIQWRQGLTYEEVVVGQ